MVLNDNPVLAYADMLTVGQAGMDKFTQAAIIGGSNLYNQRNVIRSDGQRQIVVDTATFANGGISALASALSRAGPVSIDTVENWSQLHTSTGGVAAPIGTAVSLNSFLQTASQQVTQQAVNPNQVTATQQTQATAGGTSLPASNNVVALPQNISDMLNGTTYGVSNTLLLAGAVGVGLMWWASKEGR